MSEWTVRAPEKGDSDALTGPMIRADGHRGTGRLTCFPRGRIEARARPTDPNMHSLFGRIEGRAIGWTTPVRGRSRATPAGDIAVANTDTRHKRSHRRGLSDALVDLTDTRLGLVGLELRLHTDSPGAIALQDRLGFESEGAGLASNMRNGKLIEIRLIGRLKASAQMEGKT